ncbi:uncharacterized protein SCHCODRAFT_02521376 [Schizophyllum commune H4-8]|nr:uncharacterized protein SCHCODRAFT_02521376 [Schizophyllum commune H4-8]KAI5885104.1 hypothetical protein SCHCODRAFT_02521376 [Schizophyllum commune H4-8]
MILDLSYFAAFCFAFTFLPLARADTICSGGGCYDTHKPSTPAIIGIVIAIVASASLIGWSIARCVRARRQSQPRNGQYAFVSHGPGHTTTEFGKAVRLQSGMNARGGVVV